MPAFSMRFGLFPQLARKGHGLAVPEKLGKLTASLAFVGALLEEPSEKKGTREAWFYIYTHFIKYVTDSFVL